MKEVEQLDIKDIFSDIDFPTEKELKDKEDSFSVGDRVQVVRNIRCRQAGKIGTISEIKPEDEYGWKSFVVKFDDEEYGSVEFQSNAINKIGKIDLNSREIKMKRLVLEEVWEPTHQPGDLNLPDDEIREDLKLLLSRKVSNPITDDYDKNKLGRGFIIKYMGEDAIRNFGKPEDEYYYVDKKELRIAIAIQLRYNRHRKTEFTEQDYTDFLMLFKSQKEPSNTKDFDNTLRKEPQGFIEAMATNGNHHWSFEDFIRRNAKENEQKNKVDNIISVLRPQLEDWHKGFIEGTREYWNDVYDNAKNHFQEYKDKYETELAKAIEKYGSERRINQTLQWNPYNQDLQDYKYAKKYFDRVKWVEHTSKEENTNRMVNMAEQMYEDHLHRVSLKIMEYKVDIPNLRVSYVQRDSWRTFRLGVTDGFHNLYARSIWAAEYSDLVTPHFRFIVTDKKSKADAKLEDTDAINENTKITLTVKQLKRLVNEASEDYIKTIKKRSKPQ